MKMRLQILPVILVLGLIRNLVAGQVPHLAETPDIPLGSRDRVYTADQTSNTLSVYDPSSNRLVGVLRLGDVTPQNLSPLYSRGRIIAGRGHWSRVPPRRGAALRDSPGLLDSGSAKRRQLTEFFAASLAEVSQGIQRTAIHHRAQFWHGLVR